VSHSAVIRTPIWNKDVLLNNVADVVSDSGGVLFTREWRPLLKS